MLESDEQNKLANTEAVSTFAPVEAQERISAIDTLRGFALLGILVINLPLMALPQVIFYNPSLAGGFDANWLWYWSVG